MIKRRCTKCNILKEYRNIESSKVICNTCNPSISKEVDKQCTNCKKIKLVSKFNNDSICNSCKDTNKLFSIEETNNGIKKIFCKTCKTNIKESNFSLEGLLQSVCNSCLSSNKKFTKKRVKEGKPGIYKVKNKITNKVYIGQTSNLQKRKSHYLGKNPGYINKGLKEDISKYGIDNFSFTTILVMPNSSEQDRLNAEAYYKQKEKDLYNILPGRESKEDYQLWKDQQNVLTPNSISES